MREIFQRQKLPWLRTFLQERGIQTFSEGKCKRKAELVELAFNDYSVKLAKVSEGESKNENLIMAELLTTDEGVLPDPASILKSNWSRNLSLFPEVTFPDICNYMYLLGKTDKYSEENFKSFKSLTSYKLFKDGHFLDLQVHKVPDKSAVLVKYQLSLKVLFVFKFFAKNPVLLPVLFQFSY